MPKQVFYKISNDRQNKLLKSSLKEFVSKPYSKITVQSLTDTMKILRTDFYYYFSDKEDIYSEVLRTYYEMVKAEKEDANFHDSLIILFEKIIKIESVRARQFIIDLTEEYDPRFLDELVVRVRSLFNCSCTGDKPQVKVKLKMFKFINVVNLYLKKELSLESAREILNEK